MTGRGGSPERELARAGRGRLPTCPRPAQVRPRGSAHSGRPALASRVAVGVRCVRWPAGGQGGVPLPAPLGPHQPLRSSGRRPLLGLASWVCKWLCRPLIVTVMFATVSHPGGGGTMLFLLPPPLLLHSRGTCRRWALRVFLVSFAPASQEGGLAAFPFPP